MARGKKPVYGHRLTVHITAEMHQFLELLAKRHKTTLNDLVRQAIRDHLDEQDEVIGGRSRFASRVARQMQIERQRLDRWGVLLLSAMLVSQIQQGTKGSQALEHIARIAAQAESQIRALVDGQE